MNEYKQAYNDFCDSIENDVYDWLYSDEVEAEEAFSYYLDSEGLELLVSLEDCINGEDLQYTLECQAYESFINGNFEQFKKQYSELRPVDFQSFIEYYCSEALQLKVCKWLLVYL